MMQLVSDDIINATSFFHSPSQTTSYHFLLFLQWKINSLLQLNFFFRLRSCKIKKRKKNNCSSLMCLQPRSRLERYKSSDMENLFLLFTFTFLLTRDFVASWNKLTSAQKNNTDFLNLADSVMSACAELSGNCTRYLHTSDNEVYHPLTSANRQQCREIL